MEVNKKVIELQLDDILPNRFQPRIKFNEESLNELCESIKEHGVIQPIVVRPVGDKYEIIAGERRYKASTLAGKTTIPAIITDLNDKESAEVALIENVQRQNLTPIEEAISYKKILDMGYLNQTTLAEKLGKNQSTIANKLRLLELDDEVQEALLNSKISERHARSLLKIQDKNAQIAMLNRIINERMTVRKTDEEIDKVLNNMNNNFFMNNQVEKEVKEEPIQKIEEPIPEPLSFESLFSEKTVNPKPLETSINDPQVFNQIDEEQIESIEFDTQINPGFVDVEKIVNEAQPVDINLNQNSFDVNNSVPNNDINPFSNMEKLFVEPQIQSTGLVQAENFNVHTEEALTPKKFFNILDEVESSENKSDINNISNDYIINSEQVNQIYTSEPNFIDNKASENNIEQTTLESNLDEIQVLENPNSKFTNAMEIIKECASKLEQLGYKQEHDDFDLEDMYQVIFRIEEK